MKKAFVFDMDGVLVNSEHAWEPLEQAMLERVLGKDVASHVGDTIGLGVIGVVETLNAAGAQFDREALMRGYEECAMRVYDVAPLTEGTDALVEALVQKGFVFGVVSQSPKTWMDRVIPRVTWKDRIGAVISLHERSDLKRKPAADGYVEAFRLLEADPLRSFVLEDSNMGIAAGKASGAYTIGFRGCLVDGYTQTGADAYAETMEAVATIVATRQ